MSHRDDDELSVIALGESPQPADEEHLQQCARCRSRLDQLMAVVASARSITDDDRPVDPPAEVWAGIAAELGLGDREQPGDSGSSNTSGSNTSGSVTSLDDARRRRRPALGWLAAAAVVGLVAGSVLTGVVVNSGETSPSVIASASLEPVDASAYQGSATIEQVGEDAVLRVSVPELPAVDDGYYEVWMATSDAATMVAIGTLNPGRDGEFVLPAGMSVADFPLVDVSVEHFDGDAGHSAESVVRGLLPA